MVTARFGMEVANGGETLKGEAEFRDTGGWGYKPSDWKLAAVKLGSLKAGTCTIKLTGLGDDNDVATDGFFIAPGGFKISAAELALNVVAITSDGYVGLQSATTVTRTPTGPCGWRRGASRRNRVSRWRWARRPSRPLPLKAAGAEAGEEGRSWRSSSCRRISTTANTWSWRPASGRSAGSSCRSSWPEQFLGSLDKEMQSLEAFTAELAKSPKPDDVRCLRRLPAPGGISEGQRARGC